MSKIEMCLDPQGWHDDELIRSHHCNIRRSDSMK
jgi:hypothetical protein